jgi:hypothetical protein
MRVAVASHALSREKEIAKEVGQANKSILGGVRYYL